MGVQDEINKALETARKSGRMMIAISYVDKNTDILQHRTFTQAFPVGDFEGSLAEHAKHLNQQAEKARPISGAQGSETHKKNPA